MEEEDEEELEEEEMEDGIESVDSLSRYAIHCHFIPPVSVYKDFCNYPLGLVLFNLSPFLV